MCGVVWCGVVCCVVLCCKRACFFRGVGLLHKLHLRGVAFPLVIQSGADEEVSDPCGHGCAVTLGAEAAPHEVGAAARER